MCLCIVAFISLIGVAIFGKMFRGDVDVSPFGWSFALTTLGLVLFALNGVILILLTVMIHIYVSKARYAGHTRSGSGGIMGFLRACMPCL